MSTHADLIDALGGGTKLATALSRATGETFDREQVYKWKRNGVPWRWRAHVRRLAEAMGESVPADFLDAPIDITQALPDVEHETS